LNLDFIIDTHCHLYDTVFLEDIEMVLGRANEASVKRIYLPNIDVNTINEMIELSEKFPETCFPMMGLHPCYVKEDFLGQLEVMKNWLEKRKFSAIGEIGLDFFRDETYRIQQLEAFKLQLFWAMERDLPVVIHSRKSLQECIKLIKTLGNGKIRGIFHCFSGSVEEAKTILDLGMYLGIGGVFTYKNSGLPAVLKEIGLDRVVLETDAPYLPPVPYRGKRNEPAFSSIVADKIGEFLQIPIEEVINITSKNAFEIFKYDN
jgi:TatD DNase family protein